MTSVNPVLPHALRARRWSLASAAASSLLVGVSLADRRNAALLAVSSVACVAAWYNVVMQHRSVRAARATAPAGERAR